MFLGVFYFHPHWRRRQVILKTKRYRVNRAIRVPRLRVISETGEALGIVPLAEALKLADERGLDIVEVSPDADPPVARLMDYGKFKYSQEKKNREARKRQKNVTLKEVKLRVKIGRHDFDFKRDHGIEFLKAGHKLKVTVTFSGREMTHQELGHDLINRMLEELGIAGKVEAPPKMEGRNLSAIVSPK
ncbi:MAG: translation initiation factor IF-3 [Candidatus Wallbacteria bacterium]|nr:translation initiation factor IF-3 [Candidatus Wallbacteria bacterium]